MSFENKLVAIINKDIEIGVGLNAVAHMSIGMGADVGKDNLRLDTYVDADGNKYPNISQMPYIILRGKSNEIKKAVMAAQEQGVETSVFTDTMTGGTYQEQLDRTRKTSQENLVFYGAVFFGPWGTVSQITKRFSLYK